MPTTQADVVTEVQIPNFLVKVWNILEDDAYKDSIHWDDSGFSFHIEDPLRFSKEVLPLFFKHNNLSSFVRQLNMYGFRKVTPLEKTGLNRAQSDQEHLEFQHAYFVQGHPELLQYIKRKSAGSSAASNARYSLDSSDLGKKTPKGLENVLDEIRRLRERQSDWDHKLGQLKKENGTLWRELTHMRSSHMKQQQIVNKLIQFLLSVVQPSSNAAAGTGKRLPKRLLLAIANAAEDDDDQPTSTKRLRTRAPNGGGLGNSGNSTGSDLSSLMDQTPDTYPSLGSHPGASASLEALQQELRNSAPLSVQKTGPIIADVTDEMADSASPLGGGIHASSSPAVLATPSVQSEPVILNRVGARKRSLSKPDVGLNSDTTNPMLISANPETLEALADSSKRIEWNITPPPSDSNPGRILGGPNAFNAAPIARSLSGQDFNDFLAFMDMDLNSIRNNLTNVPHEESASHIDQNFLNTLFSDLPAVSSEANNPTLSLTAGPPTTTAPSATPTLTSSSSRPLFTLGLNDTGDTVEAGPSELDELLSQPLQTPKPIERSGSNKSNSSSSGGSGAHLHPSPSARLSSRKTRRL